MTLITLRRRDAVYCEVDAEEGVLREIREQFTFEVPGAKFNPQVRKGYWDGKKRLFKINERLLYAGLVDQLRSFCEAEAYELDDQTGSEAEPVPPFVVADFFSDMQFPSQFELRDYQQAAIGVGMANRSRLFLSPTASGKSLIIYALTRFWDQKKTLIVVPTTQLVSQMEKDFVDYGYDPNLIHTVTGGERWTDRPVTISTWQSAYDQDQEWFDQFGAVMGDEAHLFKADSLVGIMEKLRHAHVRFGFTGTLDGSKTNEMVLRGLFGPVEKVTTTLALIEQGYAAKTKIKAVVLRHPERVRKELRPSKLLKGRDLYQKEIDTLVSCEARNNFIAKLACSLTGNTLVLFQLVDRHGRLLHELIRNLAPPKRKVFFIHGGVNGKARDEIRPIIEQEEDAILVASYGCLSTGTNIKRIMNGIMASPYKSKIVVPQSIGRGLRPLPGKVLTWYDVADDFSWTTRQGNRTDNHVLKHLAERLKMYASIDPEFTVTRVDLEYP